MKSYCTLILILLFFLSPRLLAQPCSDLFISEYIEGSSFNKIIEIYNPTTGSIQLDGYELFLYSNGSDTPTFFFKMHGQLASNSTYVISNSQADSLEVLPISDTTSIACNWNGNDAVALVNIVVGDTVDVIGVIGEDPGDDWNVGSGSTKDYTLVRMDNVQEGTADWVSGSIQWLVFPLDDFTHLGSHTMTACTFTIPELTISTDITEFTEGAGTFNVKVNIVNPNANPTSVDVSVTGGTAIQGVDYQFTNQTVTFPASGSAPIPLAIDVTNDGTVEPDETIELTIQNPTNNATIGAATVVIKIIDDDGLGVFSGHPAEWFSIYPNPVSSSLHISSSTRDYSVKVLNLLGEEILREINPGNPPVNILDISSLTPGLYLLKLESYNHCVIHEFIKN